jgi:Zn-dependent peptidase ImmA (M78 family)
MLARFPRRVATRASQTPKRVAGARPCQQARYKELLVSAVSFANWEMQAGNPGEFAFGLAFLPNPHGDDDRAIPEERESWGTFSVWANGENLCAHIEQGETVDSAHWYLLPLIEWLVDNWDALLHEERLPLANAGLSAAESLRQTRMPPIALKEVDDFEWLDTWSAWWGRHCVRAAREGGLFPDLYLRRYRDTLEVSTGAEPLPGIPDEYVFQTPNRTYRIDAPGAAEAMFRVLAGTVQELQRRLPGSQRIEDLGARVLSLTSPDRETIRMAWLAGLGDDMEKYRQVARAVDEALAATDAQVRQQITGARRETPLLVTGSAYARLLYGAISPATNLQDVALLTSHIIDNYVNDAGPWLSRLDLPLDVGEVGQLTPGEQGSRLGQQACELLGGDTGGWVDIQSVIHNLDIEVSGLDLSDDEVRAVSVFGPTQRPHVFYNRRTRWGQTEAVQRFTLAHELCHLLLDREHGDELAIATGPWAPVGIEQRANAFAAAFLMPTWLLRDALAAANAPADDPETIRAVSAKLRVSASSLVDRLYNLGEITFDDRIRLRAFWL